MLKHVREAPSPDRISYLKNGYLRYETDGINSLVYREVAVKLNSLYTHILAET